MAEASAAPNNQSVEFEGAPKPKKNAKADMLRKRGLISDAQAEKRGLAMKKTPDDGETANLLTAS